MSGRHSSRLALYGLIAVVAAMGLPARALVEETGPKRPVSFEIKGVPFVKQRRDWCGPAALASVLQFHGEKITQEQIAAEITLPRRGTLNLDLLLFARRRGFEAAASAGTAERLKETVAGGLPVICQTEVRDSLGSRTHFVVVYGYDDAKQSYRVHEGTRGAVSVRQAAFQEGWRKGAWWMLVVRPKPKAAPSDAGP